jgi:hypothetical protein
MSKSSMSIGPAATDAEIATAAAQLGLGRSLSAPRPGTEISRIRQGLSAGLFERRPGGDRTLNFAEPFGDFTTVQRPQSPTFARGRYGCGSIGAKSTVQRSEMMQRTMKSEFELTQMMMAELRKHPECTEVERVLLLRPVFAVNGANWDIAVGRSARRVNRQSWDVERAIARGLQEQYDVSN